MLSTSKLELSRFTDVVSGFALAAYATYRSDARPTFAQVALSCLILLCALLILYSIWILVVSLSFHVVKIDNLSYLIVSTFDAARFPASVFRGALSFIFTFIVPLALMTTYPALALLGKLRFEQVLTAVLVAGGFLLISRLVWLRSVRFYTGAGG
jgi:ABC-2 type transport system permease protein